MASYDTRLQGMFYLGVLEDFPNTLYLSDARISGEVAIIGSAATITCTISSDREPEIISWTLNNEPVSLSRATFSDAYDASTSTKVRYD